MTSAIVMIVIVLVQAVTGYVLYEKLREACERMKADHGVLYDRSESAYRDMSERLYCVEKDLSELKMRRESAAAEPYAPVCPAWQDPDAYKWHQPVTPMWLFQDRNTTAGPLDPDPVLGWTFTASTGARQAS